MIVPDYYEKFSCIGGKCRHNCCKGGWEIEVDDAAMERFKKIGGAFGERVRAAVDEENVFRHIDGHCPLLSEDGWCEMVRQGHELCVICDEYPRFTEYYEDYCERGISVSCEAAAEIILSQTGRFSLTGETGKCDHPLFTLLYQAREVVFKILQDRETDLWKRIRLVLDYGEKLQEQINRNDYSRFDYTPADTQRGHKNLIALLSLMYDLEMLYPDWADKLDAVYAREQSSPAHTIDPLKGEQLAVYFVYRYFLKGAFDCDVLSKLKFMAVSLLMIAALENTLGDLAESARLYSIEIEHDEENVEAIYDEFLFCEDFTLENILNMLS